MAGQRSANRPRARDESEMAVARKACGNCLFWKTQGGMGKCVCQRSRSFGETFSGDMDACKDGWVEEPDRDYWDAETLREES